MKSVVKATKRGIEKESSQAMQIFKYLSDNEVRIFEDEQGEIWFSAVDVCNALGIVNARDAIKPLDDDEKMTVGISDGHSGQRGGAQKMNFISESGMYALVFRSNKPEAKAFSHWVRKEVLPKIRKTGHYETEAVIKIAPIMDRYILIDWLISTMPDHVEELYIGVKSRKSKRIKKSNGD